MSSVAGAGFAAAGGVGDLHVPDAVARMSSIAARDVVAVDLQVVEVGEQPERVDAVLAATRSITATASAAVLQRVGRDCR